MSAAATQSEWALSIETSSRLGGVALGRGAGVVDAASFSADLRHAVELFPTIDLLCRRHAVRPEHIRRCFVSGGPGSFTGVRIGITAARMIALAGEARVVRVPTLDVVAENALDLADPPDHLGVILDAKRKNVYAAAYARRAGRYERIVEPGEFDPVEFFRRLPDHAAVTGEGLRFAGDAPAQRGMQCLPEATYRPRAEMVHRLGARRADAGDFDDPRSLVPIYIRRPEAEEVWDARHASG